MIFYCSKAYGEDEKQRHTQFVGKKYNIDLSKLDYFNKQRNKNYNKCKTIKDICYGYAYINWYMNSDKNYDIFILEKQLLFNFVENKENSIKNDYFVTISISCENNNGTIKKSININLSSMALNIAMGNNLKIIIDDKVINLIELNNIYRTINNDDAIFFIKNIVNVDNSKILLSGNTNISSLFVKDEGDMPYDIMNRICLGN